MVSARYRPERSLSRCHHLANHFENDSPNFLRNLVSAEGGQRRKRAGLGADVESRLYPPKIGVQSTVALTAAAHNRV